MSGGGPGGVAVGIGKRWCGVVGGIAVAVNSRHAIRERPHVCTISGIRRERGRGVVAVCSSYENCSVLKQTECNTAQPNIPQSRTVSHIYIVFLFFLRVTYAKHCHTKKVT